MLIRLRIKDYILIDELEIDFSEGFNVLTGETGAGKSILLGAIRLVLGERAGGPVVRQGQNKAVIQALFSITEIQFKTLFPDVPYDQATHDHTVLLSREFLSSGKNVCKIDGELCSVSDLKRVGDALMAIHGQHDHQQLSQSDYQLLLLDQYMTEEERAHYQALKAIVSEIGLVRKALEKVAIDPLAIERELDLIDFQIDDIDQAELTPEDATADVRLDAMKHAEGILIDFEAINQFIDGDTEGSSDGNLSLTRNIADIIKRLERIARYLPESKGRLEWLTDLIYQLRDFKADNDHMMATLQFDAYTLMALEKRVDTINHLKRKYGSTIEGILSFRESLDGKREALEVERVQKDAYNEKLRALEAKYWEGARALSITRKKYGQQWSKSLATALLELNFQDAAVDVVLSPRGTVHELGDDHMELLVSLNKGMPLAPLKKVASGGEISRVMLGIKSLVADYDDINTLIFDEIDAGISGQTASIVAEKLFKVSRDHQVICISHLAQVALMADTHFLIEKSSDEERTLSRVTALSHEGKVHEVARIMGGLNNTDEIYENASKLLKTSEARKEQLSKQYENSNRHCG